MLVLVLLATQVAAAVEPAVMPPADPQQREALLEAVLACRELSEPLARLDCFDRATAAGSDSAPPAAAPAPGSARYFGMERAALPETPEQITGRVSGGFSGWSGRTRFVLDNGQVWEQAERGEFRYAGPDRPVVIRRGALNSFVLSPEGLNRSVRVRRIE